jgi:hypothetical protein
MHLTELVEPTARAVRAAPTVRELVRTLPFPGASG